MDITKMSDGTMLTGADIDANANRERVRQRRLRRKLYVLTPIFAYFVYRVVSDNPIRLGVPGWLRGNPEIIIAVGLICDSRLGHPASVPHDGRSRRTRCCAPRTPACASTMSSAPRRRSGRRSTA